MKKRTYKQLTQSQRIKFEALAQEGISLKECAGRLGVHRSTLYRERKRNCTAEGYDGQAAQKAFLQRRCESSRPRKLTEGMELVIRTFLQQKHSPQQISGWLERESKVSVSHETIYRYVARDRADGGDLHLQLRHGGRKRGRFPKASHGGTLIPNRKGIEQRESCVELRERYGDWEVDTVIGKAGNGVIVTAVERKSRLVRIMKVPERSARAVAIALRDLLWPYRGSLRTITSDNGLEFYDHQWVSECLGGEFYFAHPYHSWERGSNENMNGLIRQYFPKHMSFAAIDAEEVQRVELELNTRPRRVLAYQRPCDHLPGLLGEASGRREASHPNPTG